MRDLHALSLREQARKSAACDAVQQAFLRTLIGHSLREQLQMLHQYQQDHDYSFPETDYEASHGGHRFLWGQGRQETDREAVTRKLDFIRNKIPAYCSRAF